MEWSGSVDRMKFGHRKLDRVIALPPVWASRARALLLFSCLVGPGSNNAKAVCDTNANTPLDLSGWTSVQYGPFTQGPARWVLSQTNTVVTQLSNADASILLSPFTIQSNQIQGSFRVNTAFDDDFIGFVFGYQDTNHFYLFDWRQGDQTNTSWGFAQRGMSVKVISVNPTNSTNSILTGFDLGTTFPTNTNRVRLLYHNTNAWADFTNYVFSLTAIPGHFDINISRGTNVVSTISIDDNTYTNGQFGFYNFSQDHVEYSGFTKRQLFPEPVVSVADSEVLEGNTGTTNLLFNVSLSFSNCDPTMVDFFITPGTAALFRDYYPPTNSGTLVFMPGETNK